MKNKRLSLGNFLRKARKAKKLTQYALADAIQESNSKPISSQAISAWERGRTTPSFEHIEAMVKILSIDPGELFNSIHSRT